jgi:O-antigen ligase
VNFPVGALIRDVMVILFSVIALFSLIRAPRIGYNILILLIFLSILISLVVYQFIYVSSMQVGFMGSRVYVLYPIFLFSLYISKILYEERFFFRCLAFFLYLILSVQFISIVDYFSFGWFSNFLGYEATNIYSNLNLIDSFEDKVRLTGGFSGALDMGFFFVIGVILSSYVMKKHPNDLYVVSRVTFFFGVLCVFFTLSRGAIFSLVVFLIIFYIYYSKITLKFIMYLFFYFFIVLSLVYVFYDFFDVILGRFLNQGSSNSGSTQGRIDMAFHAFDYLVKNPSGIGLGTQGTGYLISGVDQRINTDNLFFWVALEIGLLGAFFYLLYYFLFFNVIFRNYIRLNVFQVGLFITYLISSLLSSSFLSPIVLITSFVIAIFVSSDSFICSKKDFNTNVRY